MKTELSKLQIISSYLLLAGIIHYLILICAHREIFGMLLVIALLVLTIAEDLKGTKSEH